MYAGQCRFEVPSAASAIWDPRYRINGPKNVTMVPQHIIVMPQARRWRDHATCGQYWVPVPMPQVISGLNNPFNSEPGIPVLGSLESY
jgi:hypothetical protein